MPGCQARSRPCCTPAAARSGRDPVRAGLARGSLGRCLPSPRLCRSCRAVPRCQRGSMCSQGGDRDGELPAAARVGVCVVGRRGWTPPVSQPGELSQEIPAGPAGSRLSHLAALSKCPSRECGAPCPGWGERGLPARTGPAVPRPGPGCCPPRPPRPPRQPRASVSPPHFPRTG